MTQEINTTFLFKRARIAFVELDEAKPYKTNPTKYFQLEVLLDPAQHPELISRVKAVGAQLAIEAYGSIDVVDKDKRCFGNGNDRKRRGTTEVYDGYPGMFYVKLKGKEPQAAPGAKHFGAVMDRRKTVLPNGNVAFIAPGHPEWPYGGCYANVKGSMWALSKKSKGYETGGPYIGMNLEAIQFVDKGVAFGRGPVEIDDFEALPDDPGAVATASAGAGAAATSAWD
jgi:hypothetical protein